MTHTPTDLIEVHADTTATPQEVMEVLEDGWLYALWVVGASHIRAVDPGWPKAGTKIHHAVGLWPLLIKDSTEAVHYEPDGRLELRARGWPLGEAHISLRVEPATGGSRITLGERAISGPGQIVRPIEGLIVPPRNREALRRLIAIAENRRADS